MTRPPTTAMPRRKTPAYEATTRDLLVRVRPEYRPEQSEPENGRWVWAYEIEVENHSAATVQLVSRSWTITDGRGKVEQVHGPGVVGETPTLSPGEAFRYVSGCPLTTSTGSMVGEYHMLDKASGERFDIAIPAFSLDLPDAKRTVN